MTKKVEDENKGMCIKCRKIFSLSNMGCQAVKKSWEKCKTC